MKIAKNDEISFDEYSYEIELQDNYFSFEKNEKEKQIRDIVARGMQSYENYLENIEVLFKDNSIKIEKIKLYFDKKFIKEKDVHIVIIEDIKNNLSKTYLIKKEDIEIFYEQYEK